MTHTPTNKRSPTRAKRWLFAAMLLGPSLVVCLALAELTLRIYLHVRGWTPNCYAAHLTMFRPHPDLGYDLTPGFRLQSGVYQISTNSLGLRGPEVIPAKASSVTRIALLGGSSAFGYRVSDGAEAARLLQVQLNESGCNVEVVNAGVPGYNLYQTIRRFDQVVAPLQPDLVIAYLGWNDLTYIISEAPDADQHRVRPVAPWWERVLGRSVLYGFVVYRLYGRRPIFAPAEMKSPRPTQAGLKAFRRNLQRLNEDVKAAGARLVICAQATAAHPHVTESLVDLIHHDAAKRDAMIELGRRLRDELESFADSRGLTFIDAYKEIPPNSEMLTDYIHLSEAGERRLAALLEKSVRPLIAPRRPAAESAKAP